MNTYEACRERLALLVDTPRELGNYNEATARFQLIDLILTDVLGWNRSNVSVEKHDRGDFTDYECGTPVALLVEAKRAGIGFSLPLGTHDGPNKIQTLTDGNAQLLAAIDQAIGYCQERSIPYAAVTNGDQWIFFWVHG